MEWIEVNLPWQWEGKASTSEVDLTDYRRRDEELFGAASDAFDVEAARIRLQHGEYDYSWLEEAEERCPELERLHNWSEPEASDADLAYILANFAEDDIVCFVARRRHHAAKRQLWSSVQPEMLEYDRLEAIAREERQRNSFYGHPARQPGTLIEVETAKGLNQYLLGHINPLRGVCDDCTAFPSDAIVKRYCVVWRPA